MYPEQNYQLTATQETTNLRQGTVLVGEQVSGLPGKTKLILAQQIHEKLKEKTASMRVFSPEELVASMDAKRFTLNLGDQQELLACVQIWRLDDLPGTMEVGTWLSFPRDGYAKGAGVRVMTAAADFAMTFSDIYRVMAFVKKDNHRAQKLLSGIGATLGEERFSPDVGEMMLGFKLREKRPLTT